jgi:hypothetical protein
MITYNLILDGVPERMHPKSFRSAFEINTNVWASREPRFMPYLEVREFPAVGALQQWQYAMVLSHHRAIYLCCCCMVCVDRRNAVAESC